MRKNIRAKAETLPSAVQSSKRKHPAELRARSAEVGSSRMPNCWRRLLPPARTSWRFDSAFRHGKVLGNPFHSRCAGRLRAGCY